ncbi:hypothetical protein [Streptomyces coerulescens]|uniref:Uncharacterized protein n=1 Tax=Streptomyces coerulescens TaxID=29304 RepID=A0ABW0CUY5_STRCD
MVAILVTVASPLRPEGILAALVPLAVTGVPGLAAVVAGHELAEVLVIGNGIRAGRERRLPAHAPFAPPARPRPGSASLPSRHP